MDLVLIFTCNFIPFVPHLMRDDIRLLNLCVHICLLTMCVLVFQLIFRTYDSLWRYAESREYLLLLAGSDWGSCCMQGSMSLLVQAGSGRREPFLEPCWLCF
jgi:FlaA1/EpsC-like NDP-sugar epimerase